MDSALSNPVLRTTVQRLGMGLATLAAVSLLVFSAVLLLPGDFAKATLGRSATPETVAALQRQLGLDQPYSERYLHWVGGALTGDFGLSFTSRAGEPRPVMGIVAPRLKNTLLLAGITALVAVPLALLLGILAAIKRNSWLDRLFNLTTLVSISFPEFFVAYTLMLLFAVKLPWFYSLARITPGMSVGDIALHLALPVLTLTLGIVAHMMRMTRSAIVSLLTSPYIEMATLKGIAPWRIILRHALPNAWAPISAVVAFNLAYLVVGVVVVEVVFVYPGVGQTMVDAVRSRDIPVVQACALIFAATYIALNLVADIVAITTNPRLLHPR
ncbi:ABC transporter permease [Pseudomonas syringae]|uniref:ABC transporter permease n=1 Tax=Pseudomonas syringae TaxID=317 RepID=A0A1C7YV55_PSESX|nr:ABC transporter permease [Pseudomonas syringae]OCR21622.1 ABC transporter permease [Pseudomonas syringae]